MIEFQPNQKSQWCRGCLTVFDKLQFQESVITPKALILFYYNLVVISIPAGSI